MHPLLSKMLARKDDRSASPAPPPFDRTTLAGVRLDKRDGEKAPLVGSASLPGVFHIDVDYVHPLKRDVYYQPEPDASMVYLGNVDADDVSRLITWFEQERDKEADNEASYNVAVGVVIGSALLFLAAIGVFAVIGTLLGWVPGNLGG